MHGIAASYVEKGYKAYYAYYAYHTYYALLRLHGLLSLQAY